MSIEPTPTPSPTPTPTPTPEGPNLAEVVQGLIRTHGDANGAILELVRQTHSLREKNRVLSGKVPPEGAVVLAGDDATKWAKYQELGQPGDVRKAVESGKLAEAEKTALLREKQNGKAAKLHDLDPDVLAALAKDVEIEIKDLTDKEGKPVGLDGKLLPKDGKVVQKAYVKDGEKSVVLDDYARDHWGKFMPALKPDKPRTPGPPPGNNPGGPPPSGERKRFKIANSL